MSTPNALPVVGWIREWSFDGDEIGRELSDSETLCRHNVSSMGGICEPLCKVSDAIAALQAAIAQPEVTHITWNADGVRTVNGVPDFVTQPPSAAQPLTCIWTEQANDAMPDTYESACGETWSFNDGSVAENNVRFCHGCGKSVEVAKAAP